MRFDEAGLIHKLAVYHAQRTDQAAVAEAEAQRRFPGSTVRGYESEYYAEHGSVVEVQVTTTDGRSCEVALQVGRGVLYTECAVAPADLPAAVRATVDARVPGGTIAEAEIKEAASGDHYSVEVERDGHRHYLRIAADGVLVGHGLRFPAQVEVPVPQ